MKLLLLGSWVWARCGFFHSSQLCPNNLIGTMDSTFSQWQIQRLMNCVMLRELWWSQCLQISAWLLSCDAIKVFPLQLCKIHKFWMQLKKHLFLMQKLFLTNGFLQKCHVSNKNIYFCNSNLHVNKNGASDADVHIPEFSLVILMHFLHFFVFLWNLCFYLNSTVVLLPLTKTCKKMSLHSLTEYKIYYLTM